MSVNENYYTDTESFLVVLDSRNTSYKFNGAMNSHVKFEFSEPISLETRSIKMSASVVQFSAPNSIYNINETNSLLSITINGTTTAYTVTYGNYNATTFISYFTTLLSSQGFSISFNSITNIFTIANSLYNFTINATSTIWSVLGFAQSTSYTSISKVLTFPYTCNFNGIQSLNIHFNNLGTRNVDSNTKSISDIIQSVPIDPGDSNIKFIQQYDFNFVVSASIIDFIEISLQDDLGNFINFNNQNWNLVLSFTTTKDLERFEYKNTFHSVLKGAYD